jgi:hypothetical protein
MYKNNSRDSSKFKGCSPLQLHHKMKTLSSAIGYYSYTEPFECNCSASLHNRIRTGGGFANALHSCFAPLHNCTEHRLEAISRTQTLWALRRATAPNRRPLGKIEKHED